MARGDLTNPREREFLQRCLRLRNDLYELVHLRLLDRIPQEVMDALYLRGLDGDDPDESPAALWWTAAFFKGRKDPLTLGREVVRRWMAEGEAGPL
jgi:hypothetical protein